MLLFSMSIFASGFSPDLEKKEKVEFSQDVDFDVVSNVEFISNVHILHNGYPGNLSIFDFKENFDNEIFLSYELVSENRSKQFKETLIKRSKENRNQFIEQNKAKINSFYLQAYRVDGYVGW